MSRITMTKLVKPSHAADLTGTRHAESCLDRPCHVIPLTLPYIAMTRGNLPHQTLPHLAKPDHTSHYRALPLTLPRPNQPRLTPPDHA